MSERARVVFIIASVLIPLAVGVVYLADGSWWAGGLGVLVAGVNVAMHWRRRTPVDFDRIRRARRG